MKPSGPEIGGVFAGAYRVLRPLGRGGVGAVFVAEQLATGAHRALKIMHPEHWGEERLRRLFEQEARIGHRIPSEHVVQVLDAGVDEATATPWLAMELLEGEDLGAHVRRLGAAQLARAAGILGQVGHALAAAHGVGVVHRDLKPENVFLAVARREGNPQTVKLLDFGVAKVIAEARPLGTLVGTPLWMAPEQILGGPVSPATDVWALGLLAFWLLTGRSYWSSAAGGVRPLLDEVLRGAPLAPASARAAELGCGGLLPAELDPWFARCVAADPADRYPDARAARAALRQIFGSAAVAEDLPPPLEAPITAAAPRPSWSGATTPLADAPPPPRPWTGPVRTDLTREVLQWLGRPDCVGVALLAPLGFGAQRIAGAVIAELHRPGEPLLPARLVPERHGASEEGFYERLLRDLRRDLPAPWRSALEGRAEASAMDRFEYAVEDLLDGPVADAGRTLLLVVDGLAQVPMPYLERWGYLMARLSGRGLKLLVWGGQELHELRTRPASGGRFSAFHVLRGIAVGPLSFEDVRAFVAERGGGEAAARGVYEETGGHPALVRELCEGYPDEVRAGDREALAERLAGGEHLARVRRAISESAEAREALRALHAAAACEGSLPRGRLPGEEQLRWLGVILDAGARRWTWAAPVMQRLAADL